MKAVPRSMIAVCVLLLMFVCAIGAAAMTASEVFDKVSPSVVVVYIQDETGKNIGLGSGVVLPGGDVATNYHVVQKAATIRIHRAGKDYRASCVIAIRTETYVSSRCPT